jgi:hypothetical protein
MEGRQQGSIFINYRIDDTGHAASRLFEDLAELYGSERVFIDHKKIAGGEPWGQRLTAEAAQAAVIFSSDRIGSRRRILRLATEGSTSPRTGSAVRSR